MLKRTISLLIEVKSKINKSDFRTIEALEKAIKHLEKMQEKPGDERVIAISLLLILHDVLRHLPSIEAIIRLLYAS